MTNSHPTNLLDLPVDILALILAPLVKFDAPIELCPCGDHGALRGRLALARTVLLAHPHLHAVACPMLYGLNTFTLSLVSGRHGARQAKMLQAYYHSDASGRASRARLLNDDAVDVPRALAERHQMGKLQLFVTPSARRRVRHFALEVGRHRGWIDDAVTPVLSDMILAGSLASLSITLLYRLPDVRTSRSDFGTQNSHVSTLFAGSDAAVFTKSPLRGFFQVLADPDLESSRLFLTRGHPSAWCKYHTKGSESDDQGMECPLIAVVDWQAIVREVLDAEGVNTAAPRSGSPRYR